MEIKHVDGRFYVETEGGDAELLYRMDGGVMSIYHTFVPESERGRGIAEKLAREAFGFAIKKGVKVRPDCPYIGYFLEKHVEFRRYADSV